MSAQPAVFLDRDGTIIRDVGYLSRIEDIEWFPWSIDAIRLLNRAGFLVCVTTNQGGIGLGFYSADLVNRAHDEMAETVRASGGRIDAFFFCPHHPVAVVEEFRAECECRKPKPGLIRQAAARFEIDLSNSFVVGDKIADIGLATSVGARGLLVKTGYGASEIERHGGPPPGTAFVADTVFEAVGWILKASGFPRETL